MHPEHWIEPTVHIHTHENSGVYTLSCRDLNLASSPTSPSAPDELWDCKTYLNNNF